VGYQNKPLEIRVRFLTDLTLLLLFISNVKAADKFSLNITVTGKNSK